MKGPKWKKEELAYLEKWWGVKSMSAMAKHLNRSAGAVKQKAYAMGYGAFRDNVNGVSVTDLSDIIGVSADNICKTWIMNNGLRSRRCGVYTVVNFDDLVKFMEKHQDLWDARKCDYYYFYSYPWFMEKLKRERDKGVSEMARHPWTYWEEQELQSLRKRGYSYSEIGKKLKRSKSSIAAKYLSLTGQYNKPILAENGYSV